MKQGVIMLGATPNTTIEEMFDELVQKVASMKKQTEAGGWRPSPCLLLCFRDRAINQIQINPIKSYVIRRSKA